MKSSRINIEQGRYNYLVLILFLALVVLVFSPAELIKIPVRAQNQVGQEPAQAHSYANLSREQVAELNNLYQGLLGGQSFSEEEKYILNRFAAGVQISELEARVVIARILYNSYVTHQELTADDQALFEKYQSYCNVEHHFIEDVRAQLKAEIKEREAAYWAAAKPLLAPDAPPGNDNCSGAIAITDTQVYPITTTPVDITSATATGDPTMCGINGN